MIDMFEPINVVFENLNDEELSNLENSLNYKLPANYRQFLLKYGRCMFSGEAIIRDADGNELGIFTMFGAKGDAGNILKDLERHPEYAQFNLVPIADDMFNNRYVIDVCSEKVGYINYSVEKASYVFIAESFKAFLNKIEVILDEE